MAAAGGRRMVQKENQAVLEERGEAAQLQPCRLRGRVVGAAGIQPPGEDNPTGAGGAAVAGAAGGAPEVPVWRGGR